MKTAHDIAKEILDTVPRDAVLVINGEVVQTFEVVKGRVRDNLFNYIFTAVDKGREKGVRFTHLEEFADGEHYPVPY